MGGELTPKIWAQALHSDLDQVGTVPSQPRSRGHANRPTTEIQTTTPASRMDIPASPAEALNLHAADKAPAACLCGGT